MECRSEPELERAAGLLMRATRPSAGLQATLDHAQKCARCFELLEAFKEARELILRAQSRGKIVLPLRPRGRLRDGQARGQRGQAAGEPEYEMAASSAADARKAVTTLECPDDERFLVQIYPDRAGPGASAVLVTLIPDWGAMVASVAPRLQVGASEYLFGPDAVARLPVIPEGAVSLILAGPPLSSGPAPTP